MVIKDQRLDTAQEAKRTGIPGPDSGSAGLAAYIRGLCHRSNFLSLLVLARSASEVENPLEQNKSLRFLVVSFRSFYPVRYLCHKRSLVISVSTLRGSPRPNVLMSMVCDKAISTLSEHTYFDRSASASTIPNFGVCERNQILAI